MDIHTFYNNMNRVYIACTNDINTYTDILSRMHECEQARQTFEDKLDVLGEEELKKTTKIMNLLKRSRSKPLSREKLVLLSNIDSCDQELEHMTQQNFTRATRIKNQLHWLNTAIEELVKYHAEVATFVRAYKVSVLREEKLDLEIKTHVEEKVDGIFVDLQKTLLNTEATLLYLQREIRRNEV